MISMQDFRVVQELSEKKVQAKCGVCSDSVELSSAVNCPTCTVPYHKDCWEYLKNKCAIYACAGIQKPSMELPFWQKVGVWAIFAVVIYCFFLGTVFFWQLDHMAGKGFALLTIIVCYVGKSAVDEICNTWGVLR